MNDSLLLTPLVVQYPPETLAAAALELAAHMALRSADMPPSLTVHMAPRSDDMALDTTLFSTRNTALGTADAALPSALVDALGAAPGSTPITGAGAPPPALDTAAAGLALRTVTITGDGECTPPPAAAAAALSSMRLAADFSRHAGLDVVQVRAASSQLLSAVVSASSS